MSILDSLGIDPDELEWDDLALCQGTDPENFFSKYESSETVRENVDAMCSACPVRRECIIYGTTNKRHGVWGGWYLNGSGGVDRLHTKHKNADDRQELLELLSDE